MKRKKRKFFSATRKPSTFLSVSPLPFLLSPLGLPLLPLRYHAQSEPSHAVSGARYRVSSSSSSSSIFPHIPKSAATPFCFSKSATIWIERCFTAVQILDFLCILPPFSESWFQAPAPFFIYICLFCGCPSFWWWCKNIVLSVVLWIEIVINHI